jgi:MoxR-like ATPase
MAGINPEKPTEMPEAETNQLRAQVLALRNRILGQNQLISRMLVSLLADGHILVEGPPGLAKTRAVKTLASGLEGDFQRIQFTPDLLPADLTGTDGPIVSSHHCR